MELLYALQSIRNAVCDSIFSVITMLGEETVFMVVGMAILWCFDKRWGFRFMFMGLFGTGVNQLLKGIFLIPRPWVLDPDFPIVEAARAEATGYSFPSGHTQSAATTFGCIAAWKRKPWLTALCVILVLLTGFSRMYLGVHTPLDVGVSLITGLVTVIGLTWLFDRMEDAHKGRVAISAGMIGVCVILLGYLYFAPVREANNPEFDLHGLKSAWTLMGTVAGLVLAWWVDLKHTHFEVQASWPVQAIKLLGGFGVIMAIRLGMKPVLTAVFGDVPFTSGIRYFLMAVAGGVFWPMTFAFWNKKFPTKA